MILNSIAYTQMDLYTARSKPELRYDTVVQKQIPGERGMGIL